MTNKDWALLLSFLGGAFAHQYLRDRYSISFVFEDDLFEDIEESDFSKEMIFDCPACGLPSELDTVMTQMTDEGPGYINYYILNCLGDHDPVATSEAWYRENVGRI